MHTVLKRRHVRLASAVLLFFFGYIWLFPPELAISRFPYVRSDLDPDESTRLLLQNPQLHPPQPNVTAHDSPIAAFPDSQPSEYYSWAKVDSATNLRHRLAEYVSYHRNAHWNRNLIQTSREQVDDNIVYSAAWAQYNPDFNHTLYNDDNIKSHVSSISANNLHEIADKYLDLATTPVLAHDFFRYLALWAHGGIWADIDTWPRQPFSNWFGVAKNSENPSSLVDNPEEKIGMIFGVDHSCCDPVDFGLTQHVFAAKQGHPILLEIIAETLESDSPNLVDVIRGRERQKLLNGIVEQWIQKRWDAGFSMLRDLPRIESPTLFGDILILPPMAFHSSASFSVRDARDPRVYVGYESQAIWREDGSRTYQKSSATQELAPTERT